MQKAYVTALYDLMYQDNKVVSILSDSGTDYDNLLFREFPRQCYNIGISEQNQVAVAAGMATCGKIPFVYTTNAFLTYRAYEFIRNDICFQNLNVNIIGMGSGLSWSTLGVSHHATEDIAALRVLPNLTLLCPASPIEMGAAVIAAYHLNGPVYIRMGMGNETEIYESDYYFEIGKNQTIKYGKDIVIFVTGSIIGDVLDAINMLEKANINAQLVNVASLKPFDTKGTIALCEEYDYVFSVEEHNTTGGLGSILTDILYENQIKSKLVKIGLHNTFAKGYGTHHQLKASNNLDAASIFTTVLNCVKSGKKNE